MHGSSPTPHGVGGLKWLRSARPVFCRWSHPSRGGWIEIFSGWRRLRVALSHPSRGGWIEIVPYLSKAVYDQASHPSRGGWIEIVCKDNNWVELTGPTPHGVGGLKWLSRSMGRIQIQSHPSRGGWIEIKDFQVSSPSAASHPSRGGWIEMLSLFSASGFTIVPPLTGWVD